MYNKYTCVELMLIGRGRIDKGTHATLDRKPFSDRTDPDHQTIGQLVLERATKED